MSLYETAPDPSDNTHSDKPSREALWDDIKALFTEAGHDTNVARYFVTRVCSPYDPRHEHPYRIAVTGNKDRQRWEEPYRARLMQCASLYLRISEADRGILHAGAEEGVQWRGEPITQFVSIVDETVGMREIGALKYREKNRDALRAHGIRA